MPRAATIKGINYKPEMTFKVWLIMNGVSQREIADLLGVSVQTINAKVNGRKDFTMEQARKIIEKYKISADVFLPSA